MPKSELKQKLSSRSGKPLKKEAKAPSKSRRKPTPRQRKAAKAIVKNLLKDKPLPTGQVLKSVGYGFGLENSPQRVIEAEGFQVALAEIGLKEALMNEGISPKRIAEKINVLLDAVDSEGIEDYTAIDKGLKHATAIYGVITEKPSENKTTYNFIFSQPVQDKVRVIEAEIKSLLTGNVQETVAEIQEETAIAPGSGSEGDNQGAQGKDTE